MIAPDVEMTDLDPEAFGLLCDLAGRRLAAPPAELHVLHDNGRVLRVVSTMSGLLPGPWPDLTEPVTDAAGLRRQHGVDRVVLIDRQGAADLSHALAAAGSTSADQPAMLRRSLATFYGSSPTVVTDPAPPEDPWVALERWMATLPRAASAVVVAYDDDRSVLALEIGIRDARVVTVRSLAEPPAKRAAPSLAAEHDVVAAVELIQLDELSRASDPWSTFVGMGGDARTTVWHGLPG